MPEPHRREVRQTRMVVAAAMNDSETTVFVQALEADHRRFEAEAVGDFDHLALVEPELRLGAVVSGIATGHDSIQSVIAAGQLNDDEDAVRMLLDARALKCLSGERSRRAAEDQRQHPA